MSRPALSGASNVRESERTSQDDATTAPASRPSGFAQQVRNEITIAKRFHRHLKQEDDSREQRKSQRAPPPVHGQKSAIVSADIRQQTHTVSHEVEPIANLRGGDETSHGTLRNDHDANLSPSTHDQVAAQDDIVSQRITVRAQASRLELYREMAASTSGSTHDAWAASVRQYEGLVADGIGRLELQQTQSLSSPGSGSMQTRTGDSRPVTRSTMISGSARDSRPSTSATSVSMPGSELQHHAVAGAPGRAGSASSPTPGGQFPHNIVHAAPRIGPDGSQQESSPSSGYSREPHEGSAPSPALPAITVDSASDADTSDHARPRVVTEEGSRASWNQIRAVPQGFSPQQRTSYIRRDPHPDQLQPPLPPSPPGFLEAPGLVRRYRTSTHQAQEASEEGSEYADDEEMADEDDTVDEHDAEDSNERSDKQRDEERETTEGMDDSGDAGRDRGDGDDENEDDDEDDGDEYEASEQEDREKEESQDDETETVEVSEFGDDGSNGESPPAPPQPIARSSGVGRQKREKGGTCKLCAHPRNKRKCTRDWSSNIACEFCRSRGGPCVRQDNWTHLGSAGDGLNHESDDSSSLSDPKDSDDGDAEDSGSGSRGQDDADDDADDEGGSSSSPHRGTKRGRESGGSDGSSGQPKRKTAKKAASELAEELAGAARAPSQQGSDSSASPDTRFVRGVRSRYGNRTPTSSNERAAQAAIDMLGRNARRSPDGSEADSLATIPEVWEVMETDQRRQTAGAAPTAPGPPPGQTLPTFPDNSDATVSEEGEDPAARPSTSAAPRSSPEARKRTRNDADNASEADSEQSEAPVKKRKKVAQPKGKGKAPKR